MTARLHIVTAAPVVVDIYANWRAEIRARDWAGVMIAGDRRGPVELPDVRRRVWR